MKSKVKPVPARRVDIASAVAGCERLLGCSCMVEVQSSKLATKARFPSPAPLLTLTIRFGGVTGAGGKLKTSNLKHGDLNFEIGTLQYPLSSRPRHIRTWTTHFAPGAGHFAPGTLNLEHRTPDFALPADPFAPRTINLVDGAVHLAQGVGDLAAVTLHASWPSPFNFQPSIHHDNLSSMLRGKPATHSSTLGQDFMFTISA